MRQSFAALGAALILALVSTATASAEVRPGVQTLTDGAQCTASFIFSDGSSTYIGQSAHCAGTGGSTATNGCEAGSRPIGTTVRIEDAGNPGTFSVNGTLAYSSWITMQARNENPSSAVCRYNDFALVRLPAGTAYDPTIPFWGGPTGLTTTTSAGQDVFTYGNSSLRLGVELLKPKRGKSLGTTGDGWNHQTYTLTPGIPGDSGSAFIDDRGRAFGSLSTVAIAPLPASNGVTDLARALDYMRANASGFGGVQLVQGRRAFDPSRVIG
jgi:hypothetical protein